MIWQKLGPVLILCSTNDHLAPFDVITKFAMMMRESGCRVDLVVWDASDHVGELLNP
jgi:acetyl esterase/lipase